MIGTLLLSLLFISTSCGQRFQQPCGRIWNIANCVCNDPAKTEVRLPWLGQWEHTRPSKCYCKDGSEWNTPPGPCEDGSFNVVKCEYDTKASLILCICEDGSKFESQGIIRYNGRGRNGGRGKMYRDDTLDHDDSDENWKRSGRRLDIRGRKWE